MRTAPNELAFGCTLRFFDELVASLSPTNFKYDDYVNRLAQQMRRRHADPPRNQISLGCIQVALNTATSVFVRVDGVRTPQATTVCLFVLRGKRGSKTFILDDTGQHDTVSIDRIRHAALECALIGGRRSSLVFHHPSRVQSLPPLLAVASSGARATAPPIAPEVQGMQSSRRSR